MTIITQGICPENCDIKIYITQVQTVLVASDASGEWLETTLGFPLTGHNKILSLAHHLRGAIFSLTLRRETACGDCAFITLPVNRQIKCGYKWMSLT